MEKSELEATVAGIIGEGVPAGGIAIHVAGDVHLYQIGAPARRDEQTLEQLLIELGKLVSRRKIKGSST